MKIQIGRTLEEHKAFLKREIDKQAEQQRLRHITPGDGQAMVYRQKAEEASAYLAARNVGEPVEDDYPHLKLEAQALEISVFELANLILQMEQSWRAISASIEAKRISSKRNVDSAKTFPDANFAANIQWDDSQSD